MAVYVCDVIGDGQGDAGFQAAIADYLDDWSAVDGRADATSADGAMLVFCNPDPDQASLIAADPRIEQID